MVGQGGDDPAAIRPPGCPSLRRSAAIRVALAVFLAGALTAGAIAAIWSPLRAKSDVIGYPIVADFNPNNYAHAYYLAVGLFPIAALLIFLGLTRIAPRMGLAVPPPRGRLRPLSGPAEAEHSAGTESPSRVARRLAAGARVALVGAILGLEVGVASNRLWLSVVLVTIGYALLVVLGSVALGRFTSSWSTWEAGLATVNSLGAPLTVAGLSLVSAHTEVQVLSNGSVHHYAWFPVWLGVPLATALIAWNLVSLRGASPARAARVERRAVLLIAAPIALFVLVAGLPGDLGRIDSYEVGQWLTETRLVLHGWLPWRDVVVPHGLLHDVVPVAVGWGVFGNSYWGGFAGLTVFFLPLTVVATYWLLVYLAGRNWPVLVIGALIFLGTWLGPVDPRFILWPLTLLLLAAVLKHFTRVRAAGLGCLVVAQAIITPEMLAAAPIVAVVVAAYEWYWRPPGATLAAGFRRTIWVIAAAAAAAGVFAIYMASQGALDDFVTVTLDFLASKFNQGIPPTVGGVAQAEYDFIALAPVAALLVSFAYAVARLRLRRAFLLADWPMAAAALYVLVYYTKFLTYMDFGHAYDPFVMATPLMIYIVYRSVTAVDGWLRTRVPEWHVGWLTTHPVGIGVLIVFLVCFWGQLRTNVEIAPARYRPAAPEPPIARVGYAVRYDAAAVDDLHQIVSAYLGPHDRLLDITNEPTIFYYWLDRDPSSRWFAPITLLSNAKLQRSLLAELRRSPPKLIVFDDTDSKMPGLPGFNGVSAPVYLYLDSRWILTHYRPLLVSHGRTIYGLPGLAPVSSLHLHLHEKPVTIGVPFLGQECYWGYAPTFLSGPAEPSSGAQPVPARSTTVHGPQVTLAGWAGDLRAREPAREVIATFNGRIVGRTTPNIARPDVPRAGLPPGFLQSGFQLSIPTWANAPKGLRVFAIGRDGAVAQLATPGVPAPGGVAQIGHRAVALEPTADTGSIDAEIPTGGVIEIKPPVGSRWSDYRWLEVDSPVNGFFQGQFELSDRPGSIPGRLIGFATLEQSPHHYRIPVSSCQQWYGYRSRRLFLTSPPGQDVPGVRLIR